MVKHIHVPIPNQRSESATSHVIKEGAVRTALTLEQQFTREEIQGMMESAELRNIIIGDSEPFWCAVGRKDR